MKNATILETYKEVKDAFYKGQDISFEMVIPAENQEKPQEQFNYGKSATNKPHTGDYLYTDGTFSAERNLNKELKGVALWVTDSRMITLWPDVPDEQMTYSEAEKWCKDNGHKLLDKDAMLAIFINRDVLKDKINLKDDSRYWIDGTETDEYGYEYHRYLYIAPVFQSCDYYDVNLNRSKWLCQ